MTNRNERIAQLPARAFVRTSLTRHLDEAVGQARGIRARLDHDVPLDLPAGSVLACFGSFGDENPIVSVLTANPRWDSIAHFPFQPLGLLALLIAPVANSSGAIP